MTTLDEIKALAKLPEKSVPLCMRGDLQASWEELDRQLRLAKDRARRGATLAGGTAETKDLDDQMAALRLQMEESTVVFTLRAMPKRRFSDLKASRPARDEDTEAGVDFNRETFPVALVQACLIDPALTLPEVEQLCDEVLTQGQWDTLVYAALMLNRAPVDIPS